MNNNLQRFISAQETSYDAALQEIRSGRKISHWMWYIFPQIVGLGFTSTSKYYAIKDINEAEAYLKDPILGKHLVEISNVLLELSDLSAKDIFGHTDAMKLKSSMTLFSLVPNADSVFEEVLEKYFEGEKDRRTISLAGKT